MQCVKCGSKAVTERRERTAQEYRRFRCRTCGKQPNERSGTLLNRVQYGGISRRVGRRDFTSSRPQNRA